MGSPLELSDVFSRIYKMLSLDLIVMFDNDLRNLFEEKELLPET